jgi:hypothetical protein
MENSRGAGRHSRGGREKCTMAVAACHAGTPKARSGCEMLEGKEAAERFIRGKQGLVVVS